MNRIDYDEHPTADISIVVEAGPEIVGGGPTGDRRRTIVEMDIWKTGAPNEWEIAVTERLYDNSGEEDIDSETMETFEIIDDGSDGPAALVARAFARWLEERGLAPAPRPHRESAP